jgi:hypothetical protein
VAGCHNREHADLVFVPEAAGHFGWMALVAGWDLPATSAPTQQRLGGHSTQKAGLIEDLDHMNWSAV